jgi:type I restriction enzyme R subunit
VYEVTEEFYVHNGSYGTREDVVFLINGIPVLVIECKNATKDEAIALGVDQIRRYHVETPEVMVPEMLFTATEAIGFVYGVTWHTVRRNLFNWKHEEVGNLEAKVKSFCSVPHLLRLLKDFILFAEKEEELQKIILRQHQTAAVDKVVARALDPKRSRGLVWHTQGSGKTYTMIKAAELLFKAPDAEKPILLMIDRNELEDQMLKNLAAVGLGNVAHADRITTINKLLDNAIVKDLGLLKHLFKAKMETKTPAYLALIKRNFDDKDVDNLIEHFRDKERLRSYSRNTKRSRCSTRSSRPMRSCGRSSGTLRRCPLSMR